MFKYVGGSLIELFVCVCVAKLYFKLLFLHTRQTVYGLPLKLGNHISHTSLGGATSMSTLCVLD